MTDPLHPLLRRQLRRIGVDATDVAPDARGFGDLLAVVDRSYRRFAGTIDRGRRSRRQAAEALAAAAARLRDERDNLESHVRERTAQLQQSRLDLIEAQQLAGLGSWSYRADDGSLELSEQLLRMLGMERPDAPDSLEGLLDHVVEDDRGAARRSLAAALDAPGRHALEVRLRDARGDVRWFHWTIASQADQPGPVARIRGAMLDITARRLAESRVHRLAFQDTLTGLPNRAAFIERLTHAQQQARVRGSRFALLFLDLDGFKEINDSLGHNAGDDLLQQVAQRIRDCLRQADLLARFGGDEFLILIDPIRRRRDVETVTRKILKAVATPLKLNGLVATISASVGIALFPDDGDDPERLLKNADAAMYQAKQNGRNALTFYASQINASLLEKLALINDLRAAVTHGEIGVHYQPIVDGHDGRIVGLEALARWTHADRGPVAPSRFVPLAEETGLIGAIGTQVLALACAQFRAWDRQRGEARKDATAPYLSVNVSPVQLREAGFVRELRAMLAGTDLAPMRLQLELTEGTVMADPAHAARVLGELHAMGVRIALDDFGTGHSSLAYLREFPIDCIKVDRAFVVDLGRTGRHEPIVPAILAIAQSLGAGVVAEGVETGEQRRALLALGCRRMQGYLFSRPLPPEALGGRLFAPAPAPATELAG
jgi:diguanylate cyclase (GGDEF)-like protein